MLILRCRLLRWRVVAAVLLSLVVSVLSHRQVSSCTPTDIFFRTSASFRIEMPFEKVCDAAKHTLQDMEEYHHSALLNDRIWLFSRKYVQQSAHNWGHRVSFTGGYSAYYDIGSKHWSPKQDIAPISNEENMEERLFVFNSNIYLILYAGFGGITFKDLYKWDTDARKWTKVNGFQVDAANNLNDAEASNPSDLLVVHQDDSIKDSIYFVSVVNHNVRVHQLTANGHLTLVHGVDLGERGGMCAPVTAARSGHDIFMIKGEHGCGFHIDFKQWISFCLNTKTSQAINVQSNQQYPICYKIYDKIDSYCDIGMSELEGDAPPFAFSGSRYTKVMPSGVWVHATGSVRSGMHESVFNGEVWSVDLNSKPLHWKKNPETVPAMNSEDLILAISDSGLLYAADNEHGVHVAKLA